MDWPVSWRSTTGSIGTSAYLSDNAAAQDQCLANLSGRGEFMARSRQPDLFVTESQSELFGSRRLRSGLPEDEVA
jgi:hypothetical protein